MFEPGRLSGRPGRERNTRWRTIGSKSSAAVWNGWFSATRTNGWTVLELEAGEELHKVVGVLPRSRRGNSSA